LRAKLASAGVLAKARFSPNLHRAAKQAMLRGLSVFSVPATYGEAFGLYVLEALAAGVPVVQPRHGAFEELLAATGGGLLCPPDDPAALAASIESILLDEPRRRALADEGRRNVWRRFGAAQMAEAVAAVYQAVAGRRCGQP
jgi:glycosyltransferase involved in cell wall biosynthesis